MSRSIVIHGIPDVHLDPRLRVQVAARAATSQELLTAVGTLQPEFVLIDIDAAGALELVTAVGELRGGVAVIGVTEQNDINFAIAAQRAGVTRFALKPLDGEALGVILKELRAAHDDADQRLCVALMGAVGGAGATALACHLAVELAEQTRRDVGLLDLDLEFGGVARAFDLNPLYTLGDLAKHDAIDADMLARAALSAGPHVKVLSRPNRVFEVHDLDSARVLAAVGAAIKAYPTVLLDLPRKLDALTGYAIEQCDRVLIIAQLTVPSVDNAKRIIEAITAGGISADRISVVINRFRKGAHGCSIELIENELRGRVLSVIPNDYSGVRTALDTGKPLPERNAVRLAVADLARKLTGGDRKPATASSGWLRSFGLGSRKPAAATP